MEAVQADDTYWPEGQTVHVEQALAPVEAENVLPVVQAWGDAAPPVQKKPTGHAVAVLPTRYCPGEATATGHELLFASDVHPVGHGVQTLAPDVLE